MRAIILATKQNDELLPITKQGCIALLPIAGKPVIEYAIESLRRVGVRQAVIVSYGESALLSSQIGNGCRWGMEILYHQFFQLLNDRVDAVNDVHNETLVVQGDVFWRMDLDSFLVEARNSGKRQVIATVRNQPVVKWMLNDSMYSTMSHDDIELRASLCIDQVDGAYHFPVNDYMRYFRVNMALANEQLMPYQPCGRQVLDGLFLDVGAELNQESIKELSAGFVGRNSYVHRSAKLTGIVVIDANVVIDRRVSVENSVILPGTYIGEMMCVKDSIVSGNTHVNIYSGSAVTIDDTLMVASL